VWQRENTVCTVCYSQLLQIVCKLLHCRNTSITDYPPPLVFQTCSIARGSSEWTHKYNINPSTLPTSLIRHTLITYVHTIPNCGGLVKFQCSTVSMSSTFIFFSAPQISLCGCLMCIWCCRVQSILYVLLSVDFYIHTTLDLKGKLKRPHSLSVCYMYVHMYKSYQFSTESKWLICVLLCTYVL
jgi:hypothetical protein